MKKQSKKIVFIVGNNGSGKNTIVDTLLTVLKNSKFMVSHTTRIIRDKEVNDVDYHFVNSEEFDNILPEFIEHNTFGKNKYGHHKSEVINNIKENNHLLFTIDPVGIINTLKWFKSSLEAKELLIQYNIIFDILHINTKKSVRLKRLLKSTLSKIDTPEEDFKKTELVINRLQRENDDNDEMLYYIMDSYKDYFLNINLLEIENNDTLITLKTKYLNPYIERGNSLNYSNSLK